jgi:8-amino-7-oxononanoate synthase
MFGVFKKHKPAVERAVTDKMTKLRLKYNPYYHAPDKVQGVNMWVEGREMTLMSTNEYLGLSQHPKVMEACKKAVDQWGTSSCGSRLANGSRGYHVELEEAIAQFVGKEACHISVAGYLGCMSSLTSFAQRGDALLVDLSIHSSLWDGVQLSAADIERFSHNDINSLKLRLESLDPKQTKIIAVDGVYSMEGHIAPLPEMVALANQFDAALVVDDAHGFGVLGKDGRGVCDHFGVTNDVDLIVGSFSKSLASTGGWMAGDKALIEYLRTTCRQIIFSAAISPGQAGAALAALRVMQEEPQHREKLWENTKRMKVILDGLGLDYWNSPSPAIPIVIGDRDKAFFMWRYLWEQGFFTVISTSPGVPVGKDLIRTAISSLHTFDQLDRFGEALKAAMKKVGLKAKNA